MHILLKFIKQNIALLFVLVLAFFTSLPLFHSGLIPTHDGEYHLIRFYEFDRVLRTGNLYPRWAPDLDFSYGLPLFTYVYPLPNYAASFLHLFGASFLESVKLVMVIATFLGTFFFYFWTKKIWGKLGAVTATTFYLFAPYRFVDIYIRGSVGEVFALSIFPGFLWAYTEFAEKRNSFFLVISSLLLALTIFSHNILGLMFFAFAFCYMMLFICISKKKKSLTLYSLLIIILSLGLSAIFWMPALLETNFVKGLQIYTITSNFPDVFQLLFPSWGSGFFDSNLGDEMSVQIGLANFLAIALSFVAAFSFWKKKRKELPIVIFSLVWFVILFCFMLSFTTPLWQTIPLIHYFQFPWRLLSLDILLCAFLAGSVVSLKRSKILTGILIAFVIITTYAYTHPAYYMLRDDAYYTSRSNFIDGTNSPGNTFDTIWNSIHTSRPTTLFNKEENVLLTKIEKKNVTEFHATSSSKTSFTQTLNISYFPGWQATIDSKHTKVFPNKNGLLSFYVPQGIHQLTISLQLTLIQALATGITLLSALLCILFLLRKKVK